MSSFRSDLFFITESLECLTGHYIRQKVNVFWKVIDIYPCHQGHVGTGYPSCLLARDGNRFPVQKLKIHNC